MYIYDDLLIKRGSPKPWISILKLSNYYNCFLIWGYPILGPPHIYPGTRGRMAAVVPGFLLHFLAARYPEVPSKVGAPRTLCLQAGQMIVIWGHDLLVYLMAIPGTDLLEVPTI